MAEPEIELDIAALFGADPIHGQRFAIYIPNKDRDGVTVDQRQWVEEALALFSQIGGGATAMPPMEGAWLNPVTGTLIREQPILVYVYVVPDRFVEHSASLVSFVRRLGRETNQGAVAIEFDGQLYFVEDFEGKE